MATNNTSVRAPGSFSPAIGSASTSRSDLFKGGGSSSTEDLLTLRPQKPRLNTNVPHNSTYPTLAQVQPPRPLYASSQGNLSASSLQSLNFSRPTNHNTNNRVPELPPSRNPHQNMTQKTTNLDYHRHGRKFSSTQGSFETYLPTAANNNLSNMTNTHNGISASHVISQTTMQHQTHMRQRSQTVPSPQIEIKNRQYSNRGLPNSQIMSPGETSIPQENGTGNLAYHNGLVRGAHGNTSHAAAGIIFPKSPKLSPGIPPEHSFEREKEKEREREKEKPLKSEKSKVKLFSRPGKIGISKDKEIKVAPVPSPNFSSFTSIQRANFSNASLTESQSSASSIYTMTNSSSATIRPVEAEEKKLEKEKHKHHFLSRQKHKLTSKDDHNLPLSSAASNSKPVDPNAPSSLYNFNTPLTTTVNPSSSSRSMSGLDLRHGGRALRDKKKEKEEKAENSIREGEISYQNSGSEKPGTSIVGNSVATSFLAASSISYASSICGYDALTEIAKNGLDRIGPDDAWPFLRTKLLAVFEGEDLRLPVEDLNRVVMLHLQTAHRKRTQIKNLTDDLYDLLRNGFTLLDQSLRFTPEKFLIPQLVEMWIFTFTVILPFMQAVFLPLDLEITKGISIDQNEEVNISHLNVRSMVLRSYRDVVILPRFEILRDLFSRLHHEGISLTLPDQGLLSPFSEFSIGRPGTAMSLDPGIASYGSQTALLNDTLSPHSRGRAFSSVSNQMLSESPAVSGLGGFRFREREHVVENSGRLMAQIIGRLLQCVGVLNSVQNVTDSTNEGESIQDKMGELARGLKLDWSERERMGRDRRGLVGAKVRVPISSFGAAIEV